MPNNLSKDIVIVQYLSDGLKSKDIAYRTKKTNSK